ncbi:MAG: type II secretion system protein GspL [Proteobacteria bacterium]|nr:type II secretion system protein GspL [Pseudomonadota bacterium]
MADWLIIRLPRDPEADASWLTADSDGNALGTTQGGPLTLAAVLAASRRVCVLVPGTDVLLAEPDVPVKAGAKLQQLVPYALEEQLADDIEDLHFALGRRAGESGRIPVAVVARKPLEQWLAQLRTAGIRADVMYADSDLLPRNPGQAVALLEDDAVVVRAPGAAPVSLPADALDEALQFAQGSGVPAVTLTDESSETVREAAAAGVTGTRGLILYTGAAEWQRCSAQVEAARAHFDGIKVQLLAGGPLALFARELPGGHAVNLLQGSYAPASSGSAGWQAWRVAAMLLGALLLLHLAGRTVQLQVLKKHERQVDASIRDTFHTAMPGIPDASDARHRMEQRLGVTRGSGTGLLGALQQVAQASAQVPGTQVQALNYHGGALEMKLSAADAASLDRVSQSFRNAGWQASLTSGSNAAAGYEGRIEVRANGS